MAQQLGFLESLGVSPVDEKDAVTAQRDQLIGQARRESQGAATGRAGGALLRGLFGAIKNKSFKGFGENVGEALGQLNDRDTAEATGLSVNQLQGRREIRRLASEVSNDGSFKDRISLAGKIAKIANEHGDSEILGSALKRISDLKTEEQEFNKLKAVVEQEEADAEISGVVSAVYKGEDIEGEAASDEKGNKGVKFFHEGQLKFVPWGDELQRRAIQRIGADPMTDAELFSKTLGKQEFNKVRNELTANMSIVRKYDAVLSSLRDIASRGNIQGVVGNAGKIISMMDNTVRTVKGLLKNFIPGDTFAKDDTLLRRWRGKAGPNDSLWDLIELPQWAREQSSDAQNYRAQVIELAYIAARAAEPSNRGLSDKDIVAALEKLGASSGNPMVMMRRSMEIVAGGSRVIDDKLETYYDQRRRDGTVISDEDVDRIFSGRLLQNYRAGLRDLYTKFEVEIGDDGRATFLNPIDVTVNPIVGTELDEADELPDIGDEEYNAALDGLFKED